MYQCNYRDSGRFWFSSVTLGMGAGICLGIHEDCQLNAINAFGAAFIFLGVVAMFIFNERIVAATPPEPYLGNVSFLKRASAWEQEFYHRNAAIFRRKHSILFVAGSMPFGLIFGFASMIGVLAK